MTARIILLVSIITLSTISCQDNSHSATAKNSIVNKSLDVSIASNLKMAKELAQHVKELDPVQSSFINLIRAEKFLSEANTGDLNKDFMTKMRAGFEFMNSNKNEEALKIFNELERKLKLLPEENKHIYTFNVIGLRAINHFRTGELDNCLHNHNEASCIMPFNDESYHRQKNGSESAIQDILQILQIRKEMNFVWLLNVAYMTLGQYPESVPKEYLIPITPPEEKELLQAFENIGSTIGVDDNKLSGGSLIDDFTGNGYYDIITSSWSLKDQVFLYVNNGDGTFTESHEKAGLKGITGGLNMTHTDYNNDGHLDFMILRGAWLRLGNYPNSLLRNNGDGTFTDVTEESGIISRHPTLSAAWADFNNDSYLDCFIANENFPGTSDSPCELFLNNGNGTFTNISNEVNANLSGLFKGVAIGDIDNDQDPDVYLTNLEGSNILLENTPADNQYGFKFSNISQVSQTAGTSQSFPCWFFDYDNDGYLDIFSGGFAVRMYNNFPREYLRELVGQAIQTDPPSVYRNLGKNKFQDMATQLGLNKACFIMGAGYGDMNNDGYLDLYFGTGEPDLKAVIPNRAFLNTAGQSFTEVTSQSRLGHLQKGHAISFADIDFDGDQDIYAVMGGAFEGDTFFNALFDNKNNENQWLKVKLEGTKSNRPAIGARLELIVTDGRQNRSIHRTVSNGSSFGENPFTVELGLLKTEKIQKLKITWPSGHLTESDKIEPNTYYLIKENDDIKTLPHKQITYKKSAHHHHHHHH